MFKPYDVKPNTGFAGFEFMPAALSCPKDNTELIMDITLVVSIFIICLCLVNLIMVIYSIINLVIIISIISNIYLIIHNKKRLKELRYVLN